jgi:nicotinamide-nucleotide amidase
MADSVGHPVRRAVGPMTRPLETAEIVAIGSELLTAHRIDTNSLFLTGQLNELGISVRLKHVVGDHTSDLRAVLEAALSRADLVITTGGLGPTDDDLTREVVAGVLGRGMHEVSEILETIASRFSKRGVPMPAINRRQAQVIDDGRWLANPNGTAPGQLIELNGQVVVLLPGPPRELKPMFLSSVAPVLDARSEGRRVRRRVIKTSGRSESQVEEAAQPIYSQFLRYEPPIDTTILASPGLVELHLSASGTDVPALDQALELATVQLAAGLGDAVFSVDGRALEEVVGEQCRGRGWRVAAAESCTGGLLLQRLTDVPGSSSWVEGGVVAYANAVKVEGLDVDPALLTTHGAVSEQVAGAMAEGVRRRLGTEVGVAITGIAGPGGGSDDKPVGTVFVAVASTTTDVRRFLFPGDRSMVRQFSAAAALNLLRRHLG